MKCPLNIWQQESVTATALAEAAEHGCSLLSFKSEKYTDCVLDMRCYLYIHHDILHKIIT